MVLVMVLCSNWELLYATCEVMQGINSLLEDQMQQLMRVECNKSGATLSTESFTYFVMQRWGPGCLLTPPPCLYLSPHAELHAKHSVLAVRQTTVAC